ncbi:MAG: 2-oxoacid:ferredoxin oxidoreductase subunit beta [Bacteroidales bacterium]|nr:2-oxoacid:ferredoxin oxidoreductase subunit beta [Bacteroidales bacterium]
MPDLTFKDFKSDQEVRWCPGCGDHAVLAALQRALANVSKTLNYEKERFVVVSGIGCSSRLPYYMATYGFHSIHGRATAISTGIKVANPSLSIWQACGDGDALAIGGNHFIHAIRRNVNINVVLFNNRIYGLTKGQYSPTSKFGAITKTSPYGTVEHPFNPGSLVLGAKGTFFARSLDVEIQLNEQIMTAAALHDGCSVMEMLTNCVIFNDGAHKDISDPAVRADRTIVLRQGEKMIFGKNRDKGLVLDGMGLKVVTIGENGITEDDILTHDAHTDNIGIHMMLADMKGPDFPVALGVIRDVKSVTYDDGVNNQLKEVSEKSKIHCMDDLLRSGSTWEVK